MEQQFLITLKDESKYQLLFDFLKSIDYIEIENLEKEETYQIPSPSNGLEYSFEDIEKIAKEFPEDKKWTYQELEKYFPQDLKIKIEVINQKLVIMPAPNLQHQIISDELVFQFNAFVRKNKLGKVLSAPTDVKFNEENTTQPDILFVVVKRFDTVKNQKLLEIAPDLVVEIWSPSNTTKEQEDKKELYAKEGVLEFWEIFPKEQNIKVSTLNEEKSYEIFSEATKTGEVKSKALDGFSLDLQELFEEIAE